MVTRRHRTRTFTALLLSHGTGHKNGTYQSILRSAITLHWARSPPEIGLSPDGFGTPIPLSQLVKDLWVQTDNVFSSSAQCTETVNKARRLIFIRRSFQGPSKLAFIQLLEAFVRPHLEYGMPACSPNLVEDINKFGYWHSSAPLRRGTTAAGPIFLAEVTVTVRPDYRIQDIYGFLGC